MSSAWATPLAHSLSKAREQNHCSARWTAPRLRTLQQGRGRDGAGPRAQVRGGGPGAGPWGASWASLEFWLVVL